MLLDKDVFFQKFVSFKLFCNDQSTKYFYRKTNL